MISDAMLYHGDCLDILPTLADKSVASKMEQTKENPNAMTMMKIRSPM